MCPRDGHAQLYTRCQCFVLHAQIESTNLVCRFRNNTITPSSSILELAVLVGQKS